MTSSFHGSDSGTRLMPTSSIDQDNIAPPRSKKPAPLRRLSSRLQAPYRGQEFSVDDDPDEYESGAPDSKQRASTLKRAGSTVRRRPAPVSLGLARVDSLGEYSEDAEGQTTGTDMRSGKGLAVDGGMETTGDDQDKTSDGAEMDEGDDEDDVSDAESFTLKDRQQAINQTHPFGIRIWKPAIYKKNRSIEKNAEGDIHSAPGGRVNHWLLFFNFVWTLVFGWWLAAASALAALTCLLAGFTPSGREYARVLWGLAGYLFYPFGKFVKLYHDEAYAHEDEGEGRSITEYEQWQSGDLEDGRLIFGPPTRGLVGAGARRGSMDEADENDSLLGHARSGQQREDHETQIKRRLFGRGQWTVGRVVFFVFFYFLIAPLILLTSALCWFMVFWIPMGRVTGLLFYHLRRHPLALSFHSDAAYSRGPSGDPASILLCTYRAVGSKYWKYTVDGTNIFFINLMPVVVFVILDYWVLYRWLEFDNLLTNFAVIFTLSLFSVIPLAYFIGQAVASISAQSSMGVGAAVNAFFATIVEVFLYCVALVQGKAPLVEGSVIGSVFAGILLLPGVSMCFGAIHRKTQRFNVKSAGVTSTMLLFAMIAIFVPTLFYQINGSHELKCQSCTSSSYDAPGAPGRSSDCQRCFYTQTPTVNDRFYRDAVQPLARFCASMLFACYCIGLWFTLRTHAAVIWNNEPEEKRPIAAPEPNGSIPQPSLVAGSTSGGGAGVSTRHTSAPTGPRVPVHESPTYKRTLNHSLRQVGLNEDEITQQQLSRSTSVTSPTITAQTLFIVPPPPDRDADAPQMIKGLSNEDNAVLQRQMAEVATVAATVAAQDMQMHIQNAHHPAARKSRSGTFPHHTSSISHERRAASKSATIADPSEEHHAPGGEASEHHDGGGAGAAVGGGEHASGGGHDAPNWGRTKSAVILLGATLLYALIAEILVDTVDVVLTGVKINQKFLGITLFALVPNTTEFLNAISFAMNGNIALSMEIGSAYALQVCLLQVPALVFFGAVRQWVWGPDHMMDSTFTLVFPQWDMVTVILCVFLFSYVYGEGKVR